MSLVYQKGAVARGEGDDVGAGDDAGADGLDVGLDLVDDLVAADGVDVRAGALLAGKAPGVVQKNRSIATLKQKKKQISLSICANSTWLKQIIIQNLNEAVVEEEPEEGGAHPGFGHDGRDHGGAHDELQRRAGECVERRRELPAHR